MKKLLYILPLAWILGYSSAFAIEDIKTTDGPGGWQRDGNKIRVQNPNQDILLLDNLNIDNSETWQTNVGIVTGIWGVHIHEFGPDACMVTQRTGFQNATGTVSIASCTTHINGPEQDFDTAEFTNFTAIKLPYSSTFISMSSTGFILQDTFITNAQLKTRVPLARVQRATDDTLSIIALRNIVSAGDRRDVEYRKAAVGVAVGRRGGLVVTEVGTRNIEVSEGTFVDEERSVHEVPTFTSISGLILYRTTAAFDSWTTDAGGTTLLQVDNVNYNDITSGGLTPAQNNNKWLYMDFVISGAGGVVDGVDTGRMPTNFLFYGTDEYDSAEDAKNAPIDLGSFENAEPPLLSSTRLILRKNQAAIEEFLDIRPFLTRPAGTPAAIQSTASLQTAYDNSANGTQPEIKTNDQNEDLTIQYEGTNGTIFDLHKAEAAPVFTVTTSNITFTGSGVATGFGGGNLIQTVFEPYTSFATTTDQVPLDNSPQQSDEGEVFPTAIITPINANNTIIVDCLANVSTSIVGQHHVIASIFLNSETDARSTETHVVPGAISMVPIRVHHEQIAGTVSPMNFDCRIGANTVGTLEVNGRSGAKIMGNKYDTSMSIREETP